MTGFIRNSPPSWTYKNGEALKNAAQLIADARRRISGLSIDNRDAIETIKRYEKLPERVFFYVDPPYIGAEWYYAACRKHGGGFDHEGLAAVLNKSQRPIALSYYPHEDLDRLYPPDKWRRMIWQQHKPSNVSENSTELDVATEMLLMNYPESNQATMSKQATLF
jgi:site-specific DNA-adenine methylase